ncbi:hypothetical protein [Pseudonocardia zijingensis]|jgi:hypothetical protein|uniref:hypothetical protein n=1 Tax=Pseudonocardia zijingensis TaxID=153376 RepID=UPI0031DCE37F
MNNPFWPAAVRRCTRCTREAAVVVTSDDGSGTVAACVEHLEWVFLLGVDEWSGRRAA